MDTSLYGTAEQDDVIGLAPQWTSYRVDGPLKAQNNRFWVWSPYTRGHAWIPAAAIGPGRAPTRDEVAAFWQRIEADNSAKDLAALRAGDPRDYMYGRYPDLAARLDCIASHESGWANIPNAHGSGAFGPFQFLRGTFYSTPTGAAGGDWHNPTDQVDAAADMLRAGRVREWAVVTAGFC